MLEELRHDGTKGKKERRRDRGRVAEGEREEGRGKREERREKREKVGQEDDEEYGSKDSPNPSL